MWNPFDPAIRRDPHPAYRRLRETAPAYFDETAGMWLLTSHRYCVAALRDKRFSATHGQKLRTRDEPLPPSLLTMDPPEHTRLKRHAVAALPDSRVAMVWDRVAAQLDAHLEELEPSRYIDVIDDVATPVAQSMMMELFDVAPEHFDPFVEDLVGASHDLDPFVDGGREAQAKASGDRLAQYFAWLLEQRRHDRRPDRRPDQPPTGSPTESVPRSDVLSQLLARAHEADGPTDAEITALCVLVVVGGYDPMVHVVGNAVRSLMQQCDAWERIVKEPDILPRATEELLRYDAPIQFTARVAKEDVEFGTAVIRRGQPVVILLGAANHDPEVFPEPERLDVTRHPNPHLGFGGGPHLCLGAALARQVAMGTLGQLIRRWPNMRMADLSEERLPTAVPRGLRRLIVELR